MFLFEFLITQKKLQCMLNYRFCLLFLFQLTGEPLPLLFYVDGALQTGAFTLRGSMAMEGGWSHPFGVRGLVVYGVWV